MRRILIACIAFLLLAATNVAAQQTTQSSCMPAPANQALYKQLSLDPNFNACRPWQSCWQNYFRQIEQAAKREPNDLIMGTQYQQMLRAMGPERANAARKAALRRAEKEPGNAVAQYLAGLASPRANQSLAYYAKAIQLDSTLSMAYFRIAVRLFYPVPTQDKKALERQYGTVLENASKFVQYCTEQPGLALQFAELGDARYWDTFLKHGRQMISHYSPDPYARALPLLWGLETRLLPKAEAQQRLVADLQALEARTDRSQATLETLARGYEKLLDFKNAEARNDEIIARFPCSIKAGLIITERFWKPKGGQKSSVTMPLADALEWYSVLHTRSRQCPDNELWYGGLLSIVNRLGLEGKLTPTQLAEEENFLAAHYAQTREFSPVGSLYSPDYLFPAMHLRTGRPLTKVDVESLKRIFVSEARTKTDMGRAGDLVDQNRDQMNRNMWEPRAQVQASAVLARILFAQGHASEAEKLLASVRIQAENLAPYVTDRENADLVKDGLTHYWYARAALSKNPWDQYVFLRLADALQPQQGISHDAGLTAAVQAALSKLGVGEVTLDNWQGSPEGRHALNQIVALSSGKALNAGAEEWKEFNPPVPLPTTAMTDLDGKAVSLADTKGKMVLVNFWAEWCGPCKLEMPHLKRLSQAAGIDVIAVSVDVDTSVVRPFLAKNNLDLPVVWLGGNFFRDGTEDPTLKKGGIFWGIPQSWLIKDGKLIAVVIGFDSSIPTDQWIGKMVAYLNSMKNK